MLDNKDLDETIRQALMNLMVVLYDCGIEQVHIGGLMRILGIDNKIAAKHDDELIIVDEKFVKYVEQYNEPRPVDQTLH
jgi:hypothetical protein